MQALQGMPDEALVESARAGELDAFNVLVDRYQGAVYTLCLRILGERGAAEDATQEAFLSAYRSMNRYEGGSFRSWLYRIAANESKDELRRRRRKDVAFSLDAPIASGSYRLAATVVLPASAGTIGALATGVSDTLVHRAGAVALKERWPLVVGFRETPLALVHLENLRTLTYAGAVVAPPIPAFYVGGQSLDDFVAAYGQRLLDLAGLGPEGPGFRWRG